MHDVLLFFAGVAVGTAAMVLLWFATKGGPGPRM